MAEQIYALAGSTGNGRLQAKLAATLAAEWPAFYLGSVAPDVNAISPLPRRETHFYRVPPDEAEMAYPTMLARYPQLNNVAEMSPAQAMFVAAYSAHLLLDLVWLRQIVYPFFYLPTHLGDRQQRELTHFILLTYLDTIALRALPETAEATLAAANPHQWVPFIADDILRDWQEMLVAQLAPNAPVKTIEIYAGRLGMSAEAFAANLQNPDWMQAQVFDKIPVAEVQAVLQRAVAPSLELITHYLKIPV
ncbi:MAG: hypothetical protein IPM53_14045 [Anaerolineaceae bacterium]|nr:hypothetical protein [Anaerolineaceae bacterium]